jgi:uncharacterized protein (TIGR03086 family)
MDPLAFHRDALGVAQRVVDDIDRSHFEMPTPCEAWNVRQVLEHMIGGNRRIAGDPPAEDDDVIGDDLSAAYAASAAGAAATFEAAGGLDRTFKLSFGEVPGDVAVRARATDQLAHAWDLAKATGMSTDLSPALYVTGLELLQHRFATTGRNPVSFAEEQLPLVGASAADRFAAFAGRRP